MMLVKRFNFINNQINDCLQSCENRESAGCFHVGEVGELYLKMSYASLWCIISMAYSKYDRAKFVTVKQPIFLSSLRPT